MKEDLVYIDHILQSITKISNYIGNMSQSDFEQNEMLQDAVIRNIEIIGEATKNISKKIKENNAHIPWKEMAGMRDKLIHDYLGVDTKVIWKTVEKDIPELKQLLKEINPNY